MLKATYCALALLIGAAIGGFAPKEWRGNDRVQTAAFVPSYHNAVR